MPDEDARTESAPPEEIDSSSDGNNSAPALPPTPATPGTTAEIQYNQLNIQQIPPSVLDRLPPDQVVELYNSTLKYMDTVNNRRFEVAITESNRKGAAEKRNVWIGTLLSIVGLGCASLLAVSGHEEVALAVVTFLATIIAVVVGNKLLK